MFNPSAAMFNSMLPNTASYISPSNSTETIEMKFSCQGLLDADLFSLSDPFIEVYLNMETRKKIFLGRTETIQNQLNPCFKKPVYLQYQYEVYQQIEVHVFDQDEGDKRDFLGTASFTVPKLLMASHTDGLVIPLNLTANKTKGHLTIKYEKVSPNRKNYFFKVRCSQVKDIEWFSKSDPFLRIYRPSAQYVAESYFQPAQIPPSGWVQCHETEHYDDNLNPSFVGFFVQSNTLNGNDERVLNKWEIWDWEEDGAHRIISTGYAGVCQMTSANYAFDTLDKKGKFAGKIIIEVAGQRKIYQISDYLRIGLKFHLTVGVDFTGSNGLPTNPTSLHYIPPGGLAANPQANQYVKAITQVGQIVIEYDDDGMIPAFGYGANLMGSSTVSHCFPLSLDFSNPFVQGVQGLLDAYGLALNSVKLNGPTYFSPILKECLEAVKLGYEQSKLHYTIMLMITDGQINDFHETVGVIVEASQYPMSVIVVGVGTADFSGMEGLDSDSELLTDSRTGKKAKRDIVQFVPFRNFANNPALLAEEVLRELPAQVDQFYQLINISPE